MNIMHGGKWEGAEVRIVSESSRFEEERSWHHTYFLVLIVIIASEKATVLKQFFCLQGCVILAHSHLRQRGY